MNPARLRLSDPTPPAPAAPRPDPITTWLDTLSMVLRLPADQRENVREELAGHLKDRVRDLMLAGAPEAQASHTALEELGDAVHLAQRLQAASRTPARRLAMNLTILGVAGAALVTSMVALRGGGQNGPGVPASTMPTAAAPAIPDEVEKMRLSTRPDESWRSFFEKVAEKSKLPVDVRWRPLEQHGHQPQDVMPISFTDTSLAQAVKFINEEIVPVGGEIDYRVIDNRLVFATQEYFDQQETVIVAYDLSSQIADRAKFGEAAPAETATNVANEVSQLLSHMVHPESWVDNGGGLSSMAVFGSKLFIKAPKRFHTEIKWVIDELPSSAEHAAADPTLSYTIQRHAVPVLDDLPLVGGTRVIDFTQSDAQSTTTTPAPAQPAPTPRPATGPASTSPAPQPPRR